MKKEILAVILLLLVLLCLAGCDNSASNTKNKQISITLDCVDGMFENTNDTLVMLYLDGEGYFEDALTDFGEPLSYYGNAIMDNSRFLFWSEDGTSVFDMTQPITEDITLYAVFDAHYAVRFLFADDNIYTTVVRAGDIVTPFDYTSIILSMLPENAQIVSEIGMYYENEMNPDQPGENRPYSFDDPIVHDTDIVFSYSYGVYDDYIPTESYAIEIYPKWLDLKIGQGAKVTYELLPEGVTEKVTYSTDDPSVATVDEYGNVVGWSYGMTILRIKTESNTTNGIRVFVDANKLFGNFNIVKTYKSFDEIPTSLWFYGRVEGGALNYRDLSDEEVEQIEMKVLQGYDCLAYDSGSIFVSAIDSDTPIISSSLDGTVPSDYLIDESNNDYTVKVDVIFSYNGFFTDIVTFNIDATPSSYLVTNPTYPYVVN